MGKLNINPKFDVSVVYTVNLLSGGVVLWLVEENVLVLRRLILTCLVVKCLNVSNLLSKVSSKYIYVPICLYHGEINKADGEQY